MNYLFYVLSELNSVDIYYYYLNYHISSMNTTSSSYR